ncbi:uncharacterized protein LOC144311230 isoform X3 [Canis aureus]
MPWHSENSVCYTITDLPDKAALIWEWLVEEELEDIPGTSFHRTNVSFVRILSVSLSCLPPITVAGRSWILNNYTLRVSEGEKLPVLCPESWPS